MRSDEFICGIEGGVNTEQGPSSHDWGGGEGRGGKGGGGGEDVVVVLFT